jgi:uncharacterized protein DUF4397
MRPDRPRWFRIGGAVLLACAVGGCDATLGPESGPTRVRFVNAAPLPVGNLNIVLEGGPSANLPQGQHTDYQTATPRLYPLRVHDDGESWSLTASIEIVQGLYQTLITFGNSSNEAAILVADEPGEPRGGEFLFRVLHLAPDLGALDVHLLNVGAAVDPNRAQLSNITFPASLQHFRMSTGNYRVVLTRTGGTEIIYDSGPESYSSREVFSFVIHNGDDGSARLTRLRDGG